MTKIKDTLDNLMLGVIEKKSFKEAIVDLRRKLLKELLAFFPFYREHCKNAQDLDDFTSSNSGSEIKKRDELLTEVATRLNTIYTRLKTGRIGQKNFSFK